MGPDPQDLDNPDATKISLPKHGFTDERLVLRKSLIYCAEWTLTNDHTVIGPLRSQLREHLTNQGAAEDGVSRWDSYGMEMVSPVFELKRKSEALAQVEEYLGALISKETTTLESSARYLRKQLTPQSTQQPATPIKDAIFEQDGSIFDLVALLQRTNERGSP
ncbi:uncharacterized protein A1O5_12246 [Cladophialophora psammophila CBS 110553]|uniref:Uncharacterized protein n=1 Tax=Cladophialophora psammophila CBS 110553 TaxID=1182543 RepID=W9W302_9EURO|nr:uncharacterized protein A1O5_12246 [Cladophialophora psammophila CBS 110553]EXJ59365.1 hypothetical protein A1O5_12246 [Cladophialophora psammophila CBS 110553]